MKHIKFFFFLMSFLSIFLFVDLHSQQIEIININGKPPDTYRAPKYVPDEAKGDVYLQNTPIFDWSYGCSATAAAMLVGYYDWHDYLNMYNGPAAINGFVPLLNIPYWGSGNCPLSATENGVDGRTTRGHVDDFWIDYYSCLPDPYIANNWSVHTNGDCTGDFMGTNQSYWSNCDNNTTFFCWGDGTPLFDYTGHEFLNPPRKDGCHGLKQFIESRGYSVLENYTQLVKKGSLTNGFTFSEYKNEIQNNRPVLLHCVNSQNPLEEGHTMLGVGYNNNNSTVILHDAWDNDTHEMYWDG